MSNAEVIRKTKILFYALFILLLILIPTQVNAYTVIEFAVADPPTSYDNVTYTVQDGRLHNEYEWLQLEVAYCCQHAEYAKLPDGVAEANDDPVVWAYDDEPSRAIDPDFDGGFFTVINRTIEPGTPVEMCVSYDNNQNLTKCEYTAPADHALGTFLILQVDMDPPEKKNIKFSAK